MTPFPFWNCKNAARKNKTSDNTWRNVELNRKFYYVNQLKVE